MKKQISKLFTINLYEIFKGIIMFFLSALGDLSLQAFALWQEDHAYHINWKEMLTVAAVTTASYIIKQFFTGTKQPLDEIKPEESSKLKS